MKKLIVGISAGISFLLSVILALVSSGMIKGLSDQNMVSRWSKDRDVAHVSCFFSTNDSISEDRITSFEHSLDSYLQEAGVLENEENPDARLWVDAYSAEGKVSLATQNGKVDCDAMGIGGDFFLFHPQKLLAGRYFSGNELNLDFCILDEEAAWQLFGSNDVAGMTVEVGGVPHVVAGVIKRPTGRMVEAAGLDGTRVYLSLSSLSQYGTTTGISHYEIIMKNPVDHFVYKYVKEQLGSDEKETEVIENSCRFSLLNRLKVLGAFGTRSMNGRAIIYPYWENLAKGYEDIISVITLYMLLFLLYPILVLFIVLIKWWKHKGWTMRSVWLKMKDRIEQMQERAYARRKEKKAGIKSKDKEQG